MTRDSFLLLHPFSFFFFASSFDVFFTLYFTKFHFACHSNYYNCFSFFVPFSRLFLLVYKYHFFLFFFFLLKHTTVQLHLFFFSFSSLLYTHLPLILINVLYQSPPLIIEIWNIVSFFVFSCSLLHHVSSLLFSV